MYIELPGKSAESQPSPSTSGIMEPPASQPPSSTPKETPMRLRNEDLLSMGPLETLREVIMAKRGQQSANASAGSSNSSSRESRANLLKKVAAKQVKNLNNFLQIHINK